MEKVGGFGVMRFRLHHLPVPVARVLRTFDGLQRLYRLLAILGGAAILYLALALAAMHVDRFFFLAQGTRHVLWWLVHGLTGGVLLAGLAVFFIRRPSVRRVAYELQARLPDQAAERYVTLDSVLREPEAGGNTVRRDLLDQLRIATEAHSAQVKPFRLVRDRALGAVAAALVATAAVYGLLAVLPGYQFPLMVRRFLYPGANLPKPSFVRIQVTPGELVIGRGGEVVIQAAIQGGIPTGLGWLYRLAGAVPNRCIMATRPGLRADVQVDVATAQDWNRVQRQLFLYTQSDVQESFSYRLRCGDAETEVRFVEVVAQPRITELRLKVRPPAYTRLPAEVIVNPKQPVRLYAGSAVDVMFTVDQAVSNRQVLAGGRELAAPVWDAVRKTGLHSFTMADKVDLEVRVVNARGFANVDRVRVSLVRLEDQAPTVRLEYPPGELDVTPGELAPLQALVEDDLEVASASVRLQLNPELNPDAPVQESAIPLAEPHGARVTLTENVDLGQTPAGPGDELLMVVRVRDSKGNDGESRPVRIKVNAFARGENERHRLAALGVVQEFLAALGASPVAGGPAIARERIAQVEKLAAGAGVALEEPATMDSLLRLLEMEQHFTDAPMHKEDLRRLAAVIDEAWMHGRIPAAAGGETAWPEVLTKQVLAPMVSSRRLQDVAWRIFGMRYEAEDIRRRILALEGDQARRKTEQRQALESFVQVVAADASREGQPLREAARKELALRRQISEVKSRAVAKPVEQGAEPENPFAPLQVDVEEARLSKEDEQKVAGLNVELRAVAAERKRLSDEAAGKVIAQWQAGRQGPPPLEAPEMASLAASVYDRLTRPADGTAAATGPEALRQLVATMAAGRGEAGGRGEGPEWKSLRRRSDLYLKAVEDIGVELAAVAAAAPGRLNAERLKGLQGELNTAAYRLGRGDAEAGIASCADVVALLGRLLDEVRPALPVLARDEHKARARLESLQAAAWREVASERTRNDWRRRWVERDMQMLERNPFAPLWPRALDLALAASLDRLPSGSAGRDGTDAGLAALLDPGAAVAGAVAQERRFWDLMAAEWELGDLLSLVRVSPEEKALAAGLLEFEALLEAGGAASAEAAALEKVLQRTGAAAASLPADPGAGLRRQRQAIPLAAVEATLAPVVRTHVMGRSPLDEARAAGARLDGAAKAVAALEAALTAGDAAGMTQAILQATEALADAVRACDRVVRLAALDAGGLDPLGPGAGNEELLYLRIREAVARYRGRAGESVRMMRDLAGREPDAAQLGNLGADLTIVKAGVQALQTTLTSAIGEYGARENSKKYPMLETFAETRGWLRAAGELAGSARPAEISARFVQESPFARIEFLGARSVMLEAALRDLESAGRLLEQPAGEEAAQRKIESARTGLAAFLEAVGKSGKGELQEMVKTGAETLMGRLDRLGRPGAAGDRGRILAVADAGKEGNRLLRRLRAEAGAAGAEKLEYAGGPDRLWLQETRRDAEVSRQRLLGQVGWGRRAFTLGMLAALEPATAEGRNAADAAAWSLFCHRVARSPLSGAVTPPRSETSGDSVRNPLVKWLLEQVDEAVKATQGQDTLRNYRGITREWIPSLKDFLRY